MKFFILNIFFWISFIGIAQDDSIRFNREEFILDQKIYKPYSNYLTLNVGPSYNLKLSTIEEAIDLNYCFRLKTYFFETGYQVSSDKFVLYRSLQKLNTIYLLAGYRQENTSQNIGLFIGPTYIYGSYYIGVNTHNQAIYHGLTHHFGVLAKAEYTYKLFYDIGIGGGIFINWNHEYPILGGNIHLYFSGAYRGEAPDDR